ncbi:MAG: autotransporter domain-containing protein [Succinivibrio sp.]
MNRILTRHCVFDRKILSKHKRSLLSIAVASAILMTPSVSNAIEYVDVNQYVKLKVYQIGDQYEDTSGYETVEADVPAETLAKVVKSFEYWLPLIGNRNINQVPAVIALVQKTTADGNAFASSIPVPNGPYKSYSEVSAALFGNYFGDGGHAFSEELGDITLHFPEAGTTWYEYTMTNLPQVGNNPDLTSTIIHEMTHALGMSSQVSKIGSVYKFDVDSSSLPEEVHLISKFSEGLVDIYGNHAKQGMEIAINTGPDPDKFVVMSQTPYAGVYFTGQNVREVLNGAKIAYPTTSTSSYTFDDVENGIPVNCFEGVGAESSDFSHLELQNGLMSHQQYRNFNILMEAELAVLQDCGVQLDRRNAYGYSVYHSGENESNIRYFVNNNPYYKRTSDGQWIVGEHNPTAYGTGLHVYGRYNSILQNAEILSSGAYGIGIRVDGVNNSIYIPSSSRVEAIGTGGIGVLYAWGKNHTLNIAGSVKAAGNAVQFDFGDNCLGNTNEYQGSYIRTSEGSEAMLYDELKGPLVKEFNLSGSISGGENAIYISKNAYVDKINILKGASISGNIVSMWDPVTSVNGTDKGGLSDSEAADLKTTLSFGYATDLDGKVDYSRGDPDFNLRYNGNIIGEDSLNLLFAGGKTSINGSVRVQEVNILEGATLGGNADYTLTNFNNAGTLAPGNSIGTISISGNYVQDSSGVLFMEYNSGGGTDKLIITGNGDFDGQIHIAPYGSYFADGAKTDVSLADMIQVSGLTTLSNPEFAMTALLDYSIPSPTLLQTVEVKSLGTFPDVVYTTTITRRPFAYSRYATSDNARRMGYGFDKAASRAYGLLTDAVAALDYSSIDGRDISFALEQMNPSVYANALQGIFDHQQILSDFTNSQINTSLSQGVGQNSYAQTYITYGRRGHGIEAVDKSCNYGVIAGTDIVQDNSILKGIYINANQRYIRGNNKSTVKDNSLYAGARYQLPLSSDNSFRFSTDGRVGFDKIRTERSVAFLSVRDNFKEDYSVYGATLSSRLSYAIQAQNYCVQLHGGFDYSYLHSTSVDEGYSATAISMDSDNFNSLKTCLGVSFVSDEYKTSSGLTLNFNGSLFYRHELLEKYGTYSARFNNAVNGDFTHEVYTLGKNSIDFMLAPKFVLGDASLEVSAGGSVYPGDGSNFFGRVNYLFRF